MSPRRQTEGARVGPSRARSVPDRAVAEAFVRDLAAVYGERLVRVVLFGSVARGEANHDSDVDVVVVLDRIEDRWSEGGRLSDLGWDFFVRTGHLVHAVPVTEEELRRSAKPVFANARQEGVPLR